MSGLIGPQIEGITVGSWCPSQDGSGPPTAVAMTLQVKGFGDLVVRLKSPERVDEIIGLLEQYKKEVWPDSIRVGQHKHG